MLTGLLSPTGGSGWVGGFDIRSQGEAVKEIIGYMSQRFSLYEDLTVEQNLDFYGGIYRIPKEKKAARKAWALRDGGTAGAGAEPHARAGRRLAAAPGPGLPPSCTSPASFFWTSRRPVWTRSLAALSGI